MFAGLVHATDTAASAWGACISARPCAQVPVYVWAAEEEGQFQPGRCSRWWLHNSLAALEADLAVLGSRLVYRRAPESRIALMQLIEETGAQVLRPGCVAPPGPPCLQA